MNRVRAFLIGIWIGFWQAAAFFFRCMAEGFNILSQFCAALTTKGDADAG